MPSRRNCFAAVGALSIGCFVASAAASAWADDALPSGFKSHVRPVKDGEIDWTNGYVIAHGIGKAKGRSPRDRQMAERGATLIAARNALAITMGLKIDKKGRFADIRNGEVQIRGLVKGHKVYLVDWRPNKKQPECLVKMRVPLWGLKGVCSVVQDRERREAIRYRTRRVQLNGQTARVDGAYLIIDARGLGLSPCLFPVVEDETGVVLYDIATPCAQVGNNRQPVRYVETTLTESELRACAETDIPDGAVVALASTPSLRPASLDRGLVGLSGDAFERDALLEFGSNDGPHVASARSETSQPADLSSRGKLRVIKAVKPTTQEDGRIVLTRKDAETLASTPEGASLLRNGRVMIVVDSAFTGDQGRGASIEKTDAGPAKE